MTIPTPPSLLDKADLEQVISDLWALKKQAERLIKAQQARIDFDFLLRRPLYRDKVLAQLLKVKDPQIVALAKSLSARNLQGSLHFDDQNELRNQHKAQSPNSADSSKQSNLLLDEISRLSGSNQDLNQQLTRANHRAQQRHILTTTLSMALCISLGLQFWPQLTGLFNSQLVEIKQNIRADSHFTADNTYVLKQAIFVEDNAVLTIDAGTRILGDKGSALIVTKNASIIAKGNVEAPIVFTSSQIDGHRQRGDWGGLVLLGNAPINREGQLEGISVNDKRGRFGGQDPYSNCGLLEYVRIEFAGYETFVDNELNGLTLGGCGSNTIVRHVQVHKSLDDGIEVFGGSVNMDHIVISGPGDDAFDWDMGWNGSVQFLVVQMHSDQGDNAFEGDNDDANDDSLPRSEPTFFNASLIGSNNQQISQRAMTIRRGSGGHFGNILITGFTNDAVDLRGSHIANLIDNHSLKFDGILMHNINNNLYFSDESGEEDDDGGFDESGYFSRVELNNIFGLDPRLPASIYSPYQPDFIPQANSPVRGSLVHVPQGEFWDEGANYIGAIRPGAARSWLQDWTLFPNS